MRYSQAQALISQLIQDDTFRNYDLAERNRATERILTEVKGRMMVYACPALSQKPKERCCPVL